MWTWTPHHRHGEIADLDARNLAADLNDFTKRFVAKDEIIAAVGRRAVLERADFLVGAAHTNVNHAKFHVGGLRNLWLGMIDQTYFIRTRENGNCLHSDLHNSMTPSRIRFPNSRPPQLNLAFATQFGYRKPNMGEINERLNAVMQFGRVMSVVCFLALLPLCVHGQVPAALDARDEQAIETALRAIKMTPHDLSFQKTNVESELILQKARTFLQQPLTLPAYGQSVASNLQAVISLQSLVGFSKQQLEAGAISDGHGVCTGQRGCGFHVKLAAGSGPRCRRYWFWGWGGETYIAASVSARAVAALCSLRG